MRLIRCFGSPNSGVYNAPKMMCNSSQCCRSSPENNHRLRSLSKDYSYRCCCCSVKSEKYPHVMWASVLIGIGTTFSMCFLIHYFTEERTDLVWIITAILGAFIFALGLLILAFAPMKFYPSWILRCCGEIYPVNPGTPSQQSVCIQQDQPRQATSPSSSTGTSSCLLPCGLNETSLGRRNFSQSMPLQSSSKSEEMKLRDGVLNVRETSPEPAPQHSESTIQLYQSNATRDLSTETIARKVTVSRSVSLSSVFTSCGQLEKNNSAVTAGVSVGAKLVTSKPHFFLPVIQPTHIRMGGMFYGGHSAAPSTSVAVRHFPNRDNETMV